MSELTDRTEALMEYLEDSGLAVAEAVGVMDFAIQILTGEEPEPDEAHTRYHFFASGEAFN